MWLHQKIEEKNKEKRPPFLPHRANNILPHAAIVVHEDLELKLCYR